MTFSRLLAGAGVAAALMLLPDVAFADPPSPAPVTSPSPDPAGAVATGGMTADQIAAATKALIKASQNPVGNIAILPFQNNFNRGVGPQSLAQYNLNFQPVVPIMLSPSLNLIARTIVPVINNPSFYPASVCANNVGGCGSTFGIGDITEQLFLAPKTKPDALIFGIGPQLIFPSGSPASLSSGKFSAGPDAVALIMPGPFVIGALATQAWSYAGTCSKPDVSSFLVQPFINYNFGQGWALSTAPSITANWNADPANRWTVPVGGGITKTFKLGDQPMQLGLQYFVNVVRPNNAPISTFRVNFALLFPVKRGGPPRP